MRCHLDPARRPLSLSRCEDPMRLIPFTPALAIAAALIAGSLPATAQPTWIRIEPVVSPSPRAEYGFAFDDTRAAAVLFGGSANLTFAAVNRRDLGMGRHRMDPCPGRRPERPLRSDDGVRHPARPDRDLRRIQRHVPRRHLGAKRHDLVHASGPRARAARRRVHGFRSEPRRHGPLRWPVAGPRRPRRHLGVRRDLGAARPSAVRPPAGSSAWPTMRRAE